MKKSFLVAFNKQLKDLVQKLNVMIPNNEDLTLAKNMFHVPIMTKESIYLEHFYDTAKLYESEIMSKNEDFFMNFDISELFSVGNSNVSPDLINHKHNEAKHLCNSFDQKSKEALWQYVQVLFKLAKKYYN